MRVCERYQSTSRACVTMRLHSVRKCLQLELQPSPRSSLKTQRRRKDSCSDQQKGHRYLWRYGLDHWSLRTNDQYGHLLYTPRDSAVLSQQLCEYFGSSLNYDGATAQWSEYKASGWSPSSKQEVLVYRSCWLTASSRLHANAR